MTCPPVVHSPNRGHHEHETEEIGSRWHASPLKSVRGRRRTGGLRRLLCRAVDGAYRAGLLVDLVGHGLTEDLVASQRDERDDPDENDVLDEVRTPGVLDQP